MGYYINEIDGESIGATSQEKCDALIKAGAIEVDGTAFQENLICVVNNGPFAAAGYAYSEAEYNAFAEPDGRPRRWFTIDRAKELAK